MPRPLTTDAWGHIAPMPRVRRRRSLAEIAARDQDRAIWQSAMAARIPEREYLAALADCDDFGITPTPSIARAIVRFGMN